MVLLSNKMVVSASSIPATNKHMLDIFDTDSDYEQIRSI